MLGHVQAIDAGVVGGPREHEPFVEQGRERALAVLDVVEKSEFHGSSAKASGAMSGGWD